jgi:hypothetical protein
VHVDGCPVRPDEGTRLVHNLEEPVGDRHVLEHDPQVVLEPVRVVLTLRGGGRRAEEGKVELGLQALLDDSLLFAVQLLFRHVEEMGEDVAVVDEEALLDRPARNARPS